MRSPAFLPRVAKPLNLPRSAGLLRGECRDRFLLPAVIIEREGRWPCRGLQRRRDRWIMELRKPADDDPTCRAALGLEDRRADAGDLDVLTERCEQVAGPAPQEGIAGGVEDLADEIAMGI